MDYRKVVDYRKYRTGRLTGCAAATAALMALAAPAHAQQTAPAPAPAPTPAPSPTRSGPPNVMYLPNVVPERFSIGGSPAPTPTPVPVPPPVVASTPAARTGPAQPSARQAQAPVRTATPAPAPAATAAPADQTAAPQPATVQPSAVQPTPVATPVAVAPAPAATPGWLWALGGAAGTALLLGAFWALRRRRTDPEEQVSAAAPVAVPEPPLRASPPGLAPRPQPAAPQSATPPQPVPPAPVMPAAAASDPFELVVQPLRVEVNEQEVVLEIELLIGNRQSASAEAIRPSLALISANPDQDRHIAGFHANPMVDPAGRAFDLAAGAGGRMPARLRVRREHIHVVQVGGRPMFVPIVMIDLRWRGGLSVRRFGSDFMIGTAGQGAKLGPIWLDRAQLAAPLAATRYVPRPAPVAA